MVAREEPSPKPRPGSFASVLAGLAAKRKADEGPSDEFNPAEDVVTLTYEQALRGHGRYREGAPGVEGAEARTSIANDTDARRAAEPERPLVSEDLMGREKAAKPLDKTEDLRATARKAASVTVRLSEAECAQVHARALEANMTMSAYVRSCVFEAESLRAQVKQALAEMRAEERPSRDVPRGPREREISSAGGWKGRLFPRWAARKSAQA